MGSFRALCQKGSTVPLLFAFCMLPVSSVDGNAVISSGHGHGTYYYDIQQAGACSTSFENINTGAVRCSTSPISLNHMNTNFVVAMNNTQLGEDLSLYCGKRAIVTVNGKRQDLPLFIGDGCERCSLGSPSDRTWNPNGAPGLDFSFTVLDRLSSGNACNDGVLEISWEIVDEVLYPFDGASAGTFAPEQTAVQSKSSPSADPTHVSPTCGTALEGAWACNGNVLEQFLGSSWSPRATCPVGSTCRGGSRPYCGLL